MVTPASSSRRFLAPGDKLGKYEVIRQIAVGGMAELYLARTMGLEGFEKLVCVKRILPQYINNPSFVTMFLNEARLAATLHHPNIAQVFDIGQESGEFFFSMEYIHGEDLGRLVATGRENGVPISLDCALTLVAGLCAGLHHAHEKASADGKTVGVVHRDVSPTNVLVSYDGAVKLVDFGIARASGAPSSSQTGLKGKISYMSPEQCRGRVALDRRSDVFSVGMILYELTTGRLPFTDETEYGVLHQIVNRDADSPTVVVPSYPPALAAIVMRALARDPDRRFSTALELQNQLEDFAHDNRLRVSPLVLARLMSTLFPARLEEWDHARAQGAFFVEQHVVRTLIESGKTSDGSPHFQPLSPVDDATLDAEPGPAAPDLESMDSVEQTELGPRPRFETPLMPTRMPMPQSAAAPPRAPTAHPVAPALRAPTQPPTGMPTPPPGAVSTQPPSAMPTPPPGGVPTPPPMSAAPASSGRSAPRAVPIPNMPGAVPIVRPLPAPPVPSGGTLVSSATQTNAPPPVMPLPGSYSPPGSAGGFGGSGGFSGPSYTSHNLQTAPDGYAGQAPHGYAGQGSTAPGYASHAAPEGRGYTGPGAPGHAGQGGSGGFSGGPGGYAGQREQGAGAPGHRDAQDQARARAAAAARPTLIVRHRRSRLPLAALALVGAAGAGFGVWLAVGDGDAASGEGRRAPAATAPAAPPEPAAKASPDPASVPAPEAAAAATPDPGSEPAAAGPAPTAAATPEAAAKTATVEETKPSPTEEANPASAPAPSAKLEEPARAAQPSPGDVKAEAARKKTAKVVLQDPRTKLSKPKGRPDTKRTDPKRSSKAEPKEQTWNDDSPFMPVATPKR